MFTLPHLATSLSGAGEYVQACEVFAEARVFGRKYGVIGPLARVFPSKPACILSSSILKERRRFRGKRGQLAAGAECALPFISSGSICC